VKQSGPKGISDEIILLLHREEYVKKNLSLQKVAEQIGISKVALYGRFKSLGLAVRSLQFAVPTDVDEGSTV
jgi:AraC-like DNA-binding protein